MVSNNALTRADIVVFGMGIAGENGVRHVMKSLLAEFDILMNCAGVSNVGEIKRSHLSESSYGCRIQADADCAHAGTGYVESIGGI